LSPITLASNAQAEPLSSELQYHLARRHAVRVMFRLV
jgi:hypothetical protein